MLLNHNSMKKSIIFLLLSFTILSASASTHSEIAHALAKRIIPSLSNDIVFKSIDTPVDTFAYYSKNGKIIIEGNSVTSMAVGLNNYIRRQLGANVSWFASNPVQVPEQLPLPAESYGAKASADTRFFLNYCTFGYTMPYWEWSDWERFIDWMALNGVTMPLAMTGAEQSWYKTWSSLGLSDDEILSSFTGPAHLPWHWMNNIDCFQGPLTKNWLNNQEKLQKQILARERELGMTPVLPAFAGHVPVAVKKHYPDARITEISEWGGFPSTERCYFLDPSDPLYSEVQKRFINIQTGLYGTDHIYGIDPFNEVDSPDWSEQFLHNASKGIFKTLSAADPDARWLQMTWNFYYDRKKWTKPRIEAFLGGVENDRMILLDYYCDNIEIWRRTDKYFGKPYIWCYLGNFGGNTMIAGNLKDVSEKISKTFADGGNNLLGIGGTLEGLDCNPVMHEFVLAKAWNPEMSSKEWATIWAKSRGGNKSDAVVKAWQLMADSIYIGRTRSGHACITNARPALDKANGHYTTPTYSYNDSCLLKVLDLLLSAEGIDDNTAYQFDVMNVTRQVLGNVFKNTRDRFTKAYKNGDLAAAKAEAARMENIIMDLDTLMSTDKNYSLSHWIANARRCGATAEEADKYEQNARTILTTWGYTDQLLNDYANRQWSGLLNSFYGKRWKIFNDAVISSMEKGIEFDEAATTALIKEWEGKWTLEKETLTPVSDRNPITISRVIRAKYF